MERPSFLIASDRVGTLLFCDAVSLVIAFMGMISIRFADTFSSSLQEHLSMFLVLAVITYGMFYSFGLYDLRLLRNSYDFAVSIFTATMLIATGAIIFFYFVPLGITPKINIVLFGTLFFLLDTAVRTYVHLHYQRPLHYVLLFSAADEARELARLFIASPHLGYRIVKHVSSISEYDSSLRLGEIYATEIDTVIIKRSLASPEVFKLRANGDRALEYIDFASVYEVLFKKIFPCEKENYYFHTHMRSDRATVYERVRGVLEKVIALVFFVSFTPLVSILALCIFLFSGRPIFYSQIRVGRHGRPFQLWKLRTMIVNSEPNGPLWSSENDFRITLFGKFLRRTHLDELPQLFNILKGEMSFVGPRPERPEFVEKSKADIPLYDYRHSVLPGLTGWAQVNYPYGSSLHDVREKLMYDLYHIKNRSLILDLLILLRSLPFLFTKRASRI